MKSFLLLKRLNSSLFTSTLGFFSVVIFVAVVVLLVIPYSVVKILARYTPIGRVPIPMLLR